MQNIVPPVFFDILNYKISGCDISKNANPCNNDMTKPVTEAQKNKKNASKTAAVTLTVLGAVAIGGLLAAKRYETTRQLAEYIDFTPAKTLKEAVEFAKRNLKINEFNLTDLETANYINEALVNYNNNLSRGHKKIISSVESMVSKDGAFGISCNGKTLLANEEYIKNIDVRLEEILQAAKQEGKIKDTGIARILKEVPKFDLKDKFMILETANDKRIEFLTNSQMYAEYRADRSVAEFIKQHSELPQTTDDFVKLNGQSQRLILEMFEKETGRPPRKHNKQGPFGMINHEIGHVLHRKNIGENLFRKYSDYGQPMPDGSINIPELSREFAEKVGEGLYYDIQGNVSLYATITPAEFVAETYSYLCNGCKLPDNIMNLYKKYGGVIPNENINVHTADRTIADILHNAYLLSLFSY